MKISASQFLQELQNLDMKKLEEVKGLGPIIIENLTKFVKSESFEKLQKKFQDLEKLNKSLELDFGKIKPTKLSSNGQKSEQQAKLNIEKLKLSDLELQNLEMHKQKNIENSQELEKNQIVCITGTFEITRNEIVEKLEQNNFEVASSLTKNVTILLAGEKAGSKIHKALKMGIKIVQSLDQLINNK